MTFQPPTPSRLADMTSDLSRVPLLPQHNRSIITLPTSQSSRNAHTVAQCAFALGLCALLYGALGDPTLKQIADKVSFLFFSFFTHEGCLVAETCVCFASSNRTHSPLTGWSCPACSVRRCCSTYPGSAPATSYHPSRPTHWDKSA
jgi:hypothetical protein